MLKTKALKFAVPLMLLCGAADAASVNIIRPPKSAPTVDEASEEASPAIPVPATSIVVLEQVYPRHKVAELKLFQQWTGFIKQYSGRRYPFQ